MLLRRRPVRARIYQPVTRFGVRSTDWKYIITISLVCYALPMLAKVSVKGIPLFLLSGPAAMLLSYCFFYWAHVGRRPDWFRHQMRSSLRHPVERGILPVDRRRRPRHSWLR
jgi:hypothetical protein